MDIINQQICTKKPLLDQIVRGILIEEMGRKIAECVISAHVNSQTQKSGDKATPSEGQ
ncbi:MAG: hypothetical protein WC455_21855 [Dehalococcoidia bacterium]|jgi:hypothetical protein